MFVEQCKVNKPVITNVFSCCEKCRKRCHGIDKFLETYFSFLLSLSDSLISDFWLELKICTFCPPETISANFFRDSERLSFEIFYNQFHRKRISSTLIKFRRKRFSTNSSSRKLKCISRWRQHKMATDTCLVAVEVLSDECQMWLFNFLTVLYFQFIK